METIVVLLLGSFVWLALWSVSRISRQREALERLASQHSDLIDQLRRELKELRAELRSPVAPKAPPSVPYPSSQVSAIQAPPVAGLGSASVSIPAAAAVAPVFITPPEPPAPPVFSEQATTAPVQAARATSLPPPLPPSLPAASASQSAPVAAARWQEPVASPTQPAELSVPPATSEPAPEPASEPLINWELFMGVRMLAWVGGLAAFFGIALFVKLSIDNGWIPPELRVAAAFLAGLGLLVGGLVLAKRGLDVLAHTLCASGVVSLYAVTFACHSHYHFPLFGLGATFALMVLITATAFVLAARLRAQVIALLGLLGGFLTPLLLSTGVDNPVGLFAYLALLDAGLVAVALYCNWHYMLSLAAVATVFMQAGWALRFFEPSKMPVLFVVLLGFSLLFMAASELGRRLRASGPLLSAPAVGVAAFALGFCFHLLGYPSLMAEPLLPLCLLLGADLCLLALSVRGEGFSGIAVPAGLACFAWLASWLSARHQVSPLGLQLCVVFGFTLLHVVFPLVMARLRPGFGARRWSQYFPVLALALVLIPLIQIPEPPFVVWPVILLLDLLAIGIAYLLCSVVGVVLALALSLFAVVVVLLGKPLALVASSGDSFVLLAGFFGLLFCAASYFLTRRFTAQVSAGASDTETNETDAAMLTQLPVLSALLPFVLLMMVVLRLPLASPDAVFGLALLLSLILCVLSVLLKNGRLSLVSLGAVACLELCWQGRGLSAENATGTLLWELGFYALFLCQAFVSRRQLSGLVSPWLTAALSGPLHALLVYHLIGRFWPNDLMGLIPLAFALPSLAALVVCLRCFEQEDPRRLSVLALFGGVALLFITVAIPVQFERQWITLGWALEGAALLWLFHRVPHPGLRVTGVLLLLAAFLRLTLNPALFHYHLRGELPLLNWYLYAYGLSIVCLLAGARLLAPPRDQLWGFSLPSWFQGMSCVLAFYLLNIEIADYFTEAGRALHFRFSGNFARDMSYTIGWSLFALGLLVLGLTRAQRLARRAALVLFAVALLKLFTHDLSTIGQIYRVLAFIVVALIAFVASFLYQRFLRPAPAPAAQAPVPPPRSR